MVNKYIEENYYDLKSKLRPIARGAVESVYEDLFHHCILIFLQHKKAEQAVLKKQAQFFIARIMLNQYRTDRSDFKRYDKKHTSLSPNLKQVDVDYDYEKDYLIELIVQSLDYMINDTPLNKSRAMIIIYYYSCNSNYNEVERRYGIKSSTARHSHKKGLKTLKKIIEQNDNFKLLTTRCDLGGDNFIRALSSTAKLFKKETTV